MKICIAMLCSLTTLVYSSDTQPSMPAKDAKLNAYPTLNGYGHCYEPIDPMSKQFADDVTEHRMKNAATNVLEVGVCYGLLAQSILEKQVENNHCCYTGVDLDEKHLNIATQQISKSLHENNTVTWNPVVGDFPEISGIQSLNNQFTHIGAFCVLHFSTPEKLPKTLCLFEKLLAKGGKAFISTLRADTPIYGTFIADYYRKRKESGAELPGYIEDFPKFIDELLLSDGLPEKSRQLILALKESTGTQQPPKQHLLLTSDDLAAQVAKHTKLTIKADESVVRTINSTRVPYIGMILEKN
jgi:SAM-dependent methyltransferase